MAPAHVCLFGTVWITPLNKVPCRSVITFINPVFRSLAVSEHIYMYSMSLESVDLL